ncbi:peptide-methionine (R)-S-oxide reductase MsrB [Porphyromonas sp.]|uniref:peptide-methionine (R)-S-oxide reductase MsrB n=1 Tax=Porphyromonas sp. TaxID=1924944 RepID=UPI0039C4654B
MNKTLFIYLAIAVLSLSTFLGVFSQSHGMMPKKDVKYKTIYFAGGCFWGTEHFFKQIHGVKKTEVGYANGDIPNPTYRQVSSHNTGFAETVKVDYDPQQISLEKLIDLYFKIIDPTSLNKQGNDVGTQYRTGIYYIDLADADIIQKEVKRLAPQYRNPILVEQKILENYYPAEDYHQDYLENNPKGYCHINPTLFELARQANRPMTKKFRRMSDAELKQKLTPLQYEVTRHNATERPFDNAYYNEFREGIYVDITTGEPLFLSSDKFDSGCGWASFSRPIAGDLIKENKDLSHGMVRTEVRSKLGDAHLGHVFNDGPKEKSGLRYCINSASLRFIPKEKMKEEGYAEYLKLLQVK